MLVADLIRTHKAAEPDAVEDEYAFVFIALVLVYEVDDEVLFL
jgi:hypothetical protein